MREDLTGKDDTLTIEVRWLGWTWRTIAMLVFTAGVCVVVLREAASTLAVVVGLGLGLLGLDQVLTRWRLKVGPALVSVERWSLVRSQAWTCRRGEFQVGEVGTVVDSSDRFVGLRVLADEVPFMSGHRENELEAVRSKILAWVEANPVGAITARPE